jgi:hypothetical protein
LAAGFAIDLDFVENRLAQGLILREFGAGVRFVVEQTNFICRK